MIVSIRFVIRTLFNKLTQDDYNTYDIAVDGDLTEVSGNVNTLLSSTSRGWKFTLPTNEKVLADSITFNDEIFFVAFTPDTITAANCSAIGRGTNILYRVKVGNGDPVVNNLDAILEGSEDAARRSVLRQVGIAPTPAILFPSPGRIMPGCCMCSARQLRAWGIECFEPGFENNPVRTLWTQDGIQ